MGEACMASTARKIIDKCIGPQTDGPRCALGMLNAARGKSVEASVLLSWGRQTDTMLMMHYS